MAIAGNPTVGAVVPTVAPIVSDMPDAPGNAPDPASRALYKRKDRTPSTSMLPSDGRRYRCAWLEDSITIHSDGNVSCGLDDPHAQRSFGNIHDASIAEIFHDPEIERVREKLWGGFRCRECSLYQPVDESVDGALVARPERPSTLVVETTVKCNLKCVNAACDPNNEPGLLTRSKSHLELERFQNVVDQLAAQLKTVYFFNYGEPFIHPQAEDMLHYLRRSCPDVRIVTSTNGIPLAKKARARSVVESRLDRMTFTISGITQESYARYHVNGQLGQALQGLQNVCDARREIGCSNLIITWRYLVFRWNDREKEIDAAIALAELYGVDQLCLYLTHMPANGSSYRLSPGSPLFDRYRKYIDFVHGFGCVVPDADGLYAGENVDGLGPARWTSWRAVVRRRRSGHYLRIALATNRPARPPAEQYCFVATEWLTVKVAIKTMEWQTVSFLIPWGLRDREEFDIEIIAEQFWFPIDEADSTDQRCLGVLVRNEESGNSAGVDSGFQSTTVEGHSGIDADESGRLAKYGPRIPMPIPPNNGGRIAG